MNRVELDTQALEIYSEKLLVLKGTNTDIIDKITVWDKNIISSSLLRFDLEVIGNALERCAEYLHDTAEEYSVIDNQIKVAFSDGTITLIDVIPSEDPKNKKHENIINFIVDNKDAFDEIYRLIRDGKLDPLTFLEWLSKYFLNEQILEEIFGRDVPNIENLTNFIEFIYAIANKLNDIFEDFDDICEIAKFDGLDAIPYVGSIANALSVICNIDFGVDIINGLLGTVLGFAMDDDVMIDSGLKRLEDGLDGLSDLVMVFTNLAPPYGLLVSIGLERKFDQATNLLNGIYHKSGPLELYYALNFAPYFEAANDLIFDNFFISFYVKNWCQKPNQFWIEQLSKSIGFDFEASIDKFPKIAEFYKSDNWCAYVHDKIDSLIDPYD